MTPSEKLKRDDNGLLANPPIDYVFNEDGSVNWRKMVRTDYLVANKQRTQQTDVSQLEDRDLLILLGGIKELAQIRGFTDVSYTVYKASQDYFSTSCTINWTPNYETDNKAVSFSALADAHQDNTYSFASNFLAATAENRAFVRCVRNFLNVHIVGDDEIDKSNGKQVQEAPVSGSLTPSSILESQALTKLDCGSFDDFKQVLRSWWQEDKYKNQDVGQWGSFEDVPAKEARVLLKLIND